MNGYLKLTAALAALALMLVVMGLGTQGTVQAQASITVTPANLCSGGPGCTLSREAATGNITVADTNTADNLLRIAYDGGTPTTITVKVGSVTKAAYGDTDDNGSVDGDEVAVPSTPLVIKVVEEPVPATDTFAIQAFSGNTISVDFTAASKAPFQAAQTVTVDNFAPSIIVESPENPFVTKTTEGAQATFSATITDSLAGFGASTSTTSGPQANRLQYDTNNRPSESPTSEQLRAAEADGGRIDLYVGSTDAAATNGSRAPLKASHLEKVDNGWRVTWKIGAAGLNPFITANAESGKVPWHIEAVDRAGNIARSDSSIKGKATANASEAGTQAVAANFAGGGYAAGVFAGRTARVTTKTAPASGLFTLPGANSVTVTSCAENVPLTGSPTLTAASSAWTASPINDTAAISAYAANGTFTFATNLVQVVLTATGTVNHDGNGATDEVTCTATHRVNVTVPSGADIEVLNTRVVIVDDEAPELNGKYTGYAWDGSKNRGMRLLEAPTAKRNSIMLEISDTSGLDSATVTPSAFSVAGSSVTSTLVVDTLQQAATDKRTGATGNILVFLTLESDLATSATPRVSIPVGVVKDKAGNSLNTAATPSKATDGIGPSLSLSKSADISNSAVTITIESDEDLGAAPDLWTSKVTGPKVTRSSADMRTTSPSGSLQRWTAKHTATSDNSGRYNVYAMGKDTVGTGNFSNIGHGSDPAHAKAFTYQLDTQLNKGVKPTVSIGEVNAVGSLEGGDGHVTTAEDVELFDPMIITVDFAQEGSEYTRDTYKTVTVTSANLKVRANDGTLLQTVDFDLTREVNSPDGIKHTISYLNPKVGNYTLTVKAEDVAGNNNRTNTAAPSAEAMTFTWKVVAPKPVDIVLEPGWNLISLPFQPANPAINSVIAATHPADVVMTYDNASQVWLVSRRDAETGLFTGDIAVMTANTAYFIRTANFENIEVLRPPLATAAAAPPPPPAITVVEGWNLVPVVTNAVPAPDGVAADDYFGTLGGNSTGWLKALTYNTLNRTWTSVSPGDTITVGVGGKNPCTGKVVTADKVKDRTEPCQMGPYTERSLASNDTIPQANPNYNADYTTDTVAASGFGRYILASDPLVGTNDVNLAARVANPNDPDGMDGTFDGSDRVIFKSPVVVGKGYWLYATVDGVIIPS